MHFSCPEPLFPEVLLWDGPAGWTGLVADWAGGGLVAEGAQPAGNTGEFGGVRGVLAHASVLVQWAGLDCTSEARAQAQLR